MSYGKQFGRHPTLIVSWHAAYRHRQLSWGISAILVLPSLLAVWWMTHGITGLFTASVTAHQSIVFNIDEWKHAQKKQRIGENGLQPLASYWPRSTEFISGSVWRRDVSARAGHSKQISNTGSIASASVTSWHDGWNRQTSPGNRKLTHSVVNTIFVHFLDHGLLWQV